MQAETYVYKKEVDWSLFNYGFAIPLDYQVVFKQIADRYIQRGESTKIQFYLSGKSYEARLQNNKISDRFGNRADIVQVRYSQNSDLAAAFRNIFRCSYAYIGAHKKMQEPGSKKHISLPEEYKEYLAIYTTEYDDSYVLEAINADEVEILKETVRGKQERRVEAEIDFEWTDEGAGIQII